MCGKPVPCKYKVFFFKSSRRKKFGNKLYEIRFLFRRNKRTYTCLPARDFSRFAKLDRNVSKRRPNLLQAQFFELKASIQAKLDFMMSQALCKQRVCTFGRNASTWKAVFCLVLKELRKCMLNDSVEPHGKHQRCASSVLSN